jgi:DNA-binding winged helix-turn-helix (wHTH) protein
MPSFGKGMNAERRWSFRHLKRSPGTDEVVMSQKNSVTADQNSLRSDLVTGEIGRSCRGKRSWVSRDSKPASRASQNSSLDAPRAVVTEIRVFRGQTARAGRTTALAGPAASFGPFHLRPHQRLLLAADQPLRLGSRAFDILVALVEQPGKVVSTGELMARVWPDTFVEEGNLRVQVAALRRTLRDGEEGNRYIATVAGRGYCFVAPLMRFVHGARRGR